MTLKKITKLTLVTIFSLFFLLFVAVCFTFQYFASHTNQSGRQLYQNIISAARSNLYQSRSQINFLILGLDPRDDQLEKTNVTDTIILASLNLENYRLSLIPLPRDLWFYPLN